MTTATDKRDGEDSAFKVIGTRPIRPDGADKVTGRAVYGADMRLPGMLYGKVLRSPHAHARIRRSTRSQAEALPGVQGRRHRRRPARRWRQDRTTWAKASVNLRYARAGTSWRDDKVLYHGHAVAAVAADQRAHRRGGAGADRGRVRGAAARAGRARRRCARTRPILLRRPAHRRAGQAGRARRRNVAAHIRHAARRRRAGLSPRRP